MFAMAAVVKAMGWLASLVTLVGLWLLGVADLVDLPAALDRVLQVGAGGVIVVVGAVSMRMVLRAAKAAEEVGSRSRAELEVLLDRERARSDRLLLQLDRERELRMSLERAGVVERRERVVDDDESPTVG